VDTFVVTDAVDDSVETTRGARIAVVPTERPSRFVGVEGLATVPTIRGIFVGRIGERNDRGRRSRSVDRRVTPADDERVFLHTPEQRENGNRARRRDGRADVSDRHLQKLRV
jgi:hypothetical protein